MSSDNGYILRMDQDGKFVLQEYMASDDSYPDIANGTMIFDEIGDAIIKFQELEESDIPSEYGLAVSVLAPTAPGVPAPQYHEEQEWSQEDADNALALLREKLGGRSEDISLSLTNSDGTTLVGDNKTIMHHPV